MEIKLPFTEAVATRFDALYQFLNRKYQLAENHLTIDDRTLRIFTVADVNKLVDELILANPDSAHQMDDQIPYWAEIWPASRALSRFLLNHPQKIRNKECLEIGCGVGVVSIIARQLGARVTVSDYQEDALRFSELNWLLNLGESPPGTLLDWRKPELNQTFEVILASDVAYEERFFYPLVETFRTLLVPSGRILLSEPNRKIAEKFFKILLQEGFEYEKLQVTVDNHGRTVQIGVYDIVRKSG